MQDPVIVSLSNIKQGAAVELFDHALKQVLENIKDPNAAAGKKRRITLTFEFTPYVDRSGSHVSIGSAVKLVPVDSVDTSVFVGMDHGEYRAYTRDIRQEDLFPPTPENVRPMDRKAQ